MTHRGTASRLLTLLSLLQSRREWPGAELCERLEVSGRTVRRDIERLRELGYPIESTTGPAGGYRLHAGAAMPPLLLDDDEAIAIAVGLRSAARSAVTGIEETALRALVKLEQVLPSHLRRRVQALSAATTVVPSRGGPTVDAQVLTLLAAACRDQERVRFRYRGRDGAGSRRTVEPHALVARGQRWYLLAFDPERGGWRTFRVDRVASPGADGGRFKPRPVPGGDAAAYVMRNLSSVVYRYEAQVTYRAPAEQVRRRVPPGWGEVRELDARTCVQHMSDDDLDWLAYRIGMAGVDFEVDGPPELLERLARVGARFTAAAAAGGELRPDCDRNRS